MNATPVFDATGLQTESQVGEGVMNATPDVLGSSSADTPPDVNSKDPNTRINPHPNPPPQAGEGVKRTPFDATGLQTESQAGEGVKGTPLIIGTAGHVDHGKSTLIKALTGIDPDRLKEEQKRGMTIDLGFAYIELPRCGRVGIVDVPGHERFLKNMLAGAGGVDLALVVVAADEGVMPQTREHLDILSLLDVRGIVVAITKSDLADADMRSLVEDDVAALLAKMRLPAPTSVQVSAAKGEGLDELRRVLDESLSRLPARDATGLARLPIDRVFTMVGFGTVVTGTLVSGTLREGESVRLMPGGLECRVRGLQVHGEQTPQAVAGQRVACNLAGVPKEKLDRGQVVAQPGACEETILCEAIITMLADAPELKHNARVRFHIGTAEVLARVTLGPVGVITPGEIGAAQIRCETPIACAKGDRFVIRQYSPGHTIGGGLIVASVAKRRKRGELDLASFQSALSASPEEAVLAAIRSSPIGARVVAPESVAGNLVSLGGRWVTREQWGVLSELLIGLIGQYHTKNPTQPVIPKAAWCAASPLREDTKALDAAAALLVHAGKIELVGPGVRLSGFEVRLEPKQEALLARIEGALLPAGIAVATFNGLSRVAGLPPPAIKEVLRLGITVGRIEKISEELYYPVVTMDRIREQVRSAIERDGSINASTFRDLMDSSRKYAVPILEYLDATKFTRRVGDDRVLA